MLAYLRININIQLNRILNKTLDDSVILVFRILQKKLQHLPKSKVLDLFQKDYIHAVTVSTFNMSFFLLGTCFSVVS